MTIQMKGLVRSVTINQLTENVRQFVHHIEIFPADFEPWTVLKMGRQGDIPVAGTLQLSTTVPLYNPGTILMMGAIPAGAQESSPGAGATPRPTRQRAPAGPPRPAETPSDEPMPPTGEATAALRARIIRAEEEDDDGDETQG